MRKDKKKFLSGPPKEAGQMGGGPAEKWKREEVSANGTHNERKKKKRLPGRLGGRGYI